MIFKQVTLSATEQTLKSLLGASAPSEVVEEIDKLIR